jgi:hypothetical protein
MHFQRKNLLANYESAGDGVVATVVSALEQAGSKTKVFSLWTATDSELSDIQADVAKWDAPSLAMLRGTVLGAADFTQYYPYPTPRFDIHGGSGAQVPRDQWRSLRMEDQFDAVLYLGPRSAITVAPRRLSPAICAGTEFLLERLTRLALTGLPPIETERLKQLCMAEGGR